MEGSREGGLTGSEGWLTSPPSDTSLDCLAPSCLVLRVPLTSLLTHSSPTPSSTFSLLRPVRLSLPVAPFSVSVCLSLQELPPSSVYQLWGSGTPGALTSATAPPPGSTRWPRRYLQPPPLPDRHMSLGPGRPGAGHGRGSGATGATDRPAGLGARTVGSPPWPTEGAGKMGRAAERGPRGPSRPGMCTRNVGKRDRL